MVKAILEGRKTQTRRICKDQNLHILHGMPWKEKVLEGIVDGKVKRIELAPNGQPFVEMIDCPYGKPGDMLWVRETFALSGDMDQAGYDLNHLYRAEAIKDDSGEIGGWWINEKHYEVDRWRPSIHMPRLASRITLEIVSVRVERLKDISEEDAIAEGIESFRPVPGDGDPVTRYRNYTEPAQWKWSPIESYKTLWNSINGPESWDKNPWVWVIEFKLL